MKYKGLIFYGALVVMLVSACTLGTQSPAGGAPPLGEQQPAETPSVPQGGAENPSGGQSPTGQVFVDQVEIVLMESFPLQAAAIVRGSLSDACTTLSGVDVQRQGNVFRVNLHTERPADAVCAQVLTPFEENVSLDVAGLSAGTYTVDVNGVQRAFTLSVDNTLPAEATPTVVALPSLTPVPSPTPTATFTPLPTTAESTCTNRINFVGESVPDDSSFAVGTTFEKTWTLENAGSCTWTEKYAAVFVDGEAMGAASPVTLPKEVAPGQKVTVRVTFTTPAKPGTYRSVWRLQDASGVQFGPGKNGDGRFWVQIVATESSGNLGLGNPTWVDAMDKATYWYLVDTANTVFAIKDGALEMTAKTPGAADEWGLAQYTAVDDFYLEVDFKTGDACTGLDRYGVIVRAPKPDRGYVFGFSCDGRFRLYQWDGDSYTGLQEWRAHPAIRTGPGQTNTLGIWVKGKQFKLYANGQLLGSAEDATFDKGQFGVFIASGESPKFKVRVEETRYWELAQ
ncbi:MAG: hypothetical protein Fur0018_00390 [Anaerolineales bacterium]